MNTEKLISLKENFTGQKFQWVKPENPEWLGKIVKCRDVDFAGQDRYVIIFDDGSRVDSSKLNSNLMMIHGDMHPLTKEEVASIYGTQPKRPEPKNLTAGANASAVPPFAGTTVNTIVTPTPAPQPATAPNANMFAMFNAEETQMTLNLKVRIPDRKLLKMMYASAENKEKFLSELADHLHAMINKQVVQDSIQSLLVSPAPKKEFGTTIKLKEVDESR